MAADHNPFAKPAIPKVEAGMLLGFVCPACHVLMTPTLEDCGCYACSRCAVHVAQSRYVSASRRVAELVNGGTSGFSRN